MAAVPSIGRASQIEGVRAAPEADATHVLYERYSNQIFGYCLHQLGSREEAEDAVQSTFLNAFRGLSRGVVPELEQAWLFKIAHNVCLSRRRSSWRRGRIESPEDFHEMQDTLAAPNRRDLRDELVGLQDVLEEMPDNQRRAILLREWQGLSYREIADEMELSQSAVETLIFRARRTLAQGLQEPPKKSWRKSARRGADLGGVLSVAKTFFAGGTAVKVGAAMVAVTAATVVATTPPSLHHRLPPTSEARVRAAVPVATHTRVATPRVRTIVARGRTSAPVHRATRVALERRPHAASAPAVTTRHRPAAEPSVGDGATTSEPNATSSMHDSAPATAKPEPSAPATPAHDNQNGNGNATDPKPAQASGNDNAPANGDHGNGHGNSGGNGNHGANAPAPAATEPAPNGHGQGHKPDKHANDPRVPAAATPVSDPAPQPAAPQTTTTAPAPPPAAAPPAPGNSDDHGNSGGNGNGNAGGNGNGNGRGGGK